MNPLVMARESRRSNLFCSRHLEAETKSIVCSWATLKVFFGVESQGAVYNIWESEVPPFYTELIRGLRGLMPLPKFGALLLRF